jgi:para-aminobenzoate synthetase component 1
MNTASINNREFVQQMNQLGKDGEPFVFLIDFEMQKPCIWKWNDANQSFLFNFNGKHNDASSPDQGYAQSDAGNKGEVGSGKKWTTHQVNSADPNNLELKKEPVSEEQYQEKFSLTMKHIQQGDSYLVNLTVPTQIQINLSLDEIYQRVEAKYKCLLNNEFVCFSPETFIQIKEGKIFSFPMKGTIDATLPHAEETIMADEKEAAEHATIVDLIRNDLSRVAKKVEVSRFRYYERIKTNDKELGQVSSQIEGELDKDYASNIGDLVFALLPAGSVSGAPKKKTTEIIRAVEGENRGYYTGIAGCFDGNVLDSCVLIRYIEAGNLYRSGGGITSNSSMQAEYREMIDKVYVPIH